MLPGTAYGFLSLPHILEILFIPLSLGLLLHWTQTHSRQAARKLLRGLAVAVPCLELMRIVWLFLLGEGYWVKLLPLHLCGLQVLFIPLAVFTRSETLRSYVWATSILGGITAIVYPAGIVGTYPFFHFQTFQSFALHLLLILVPVLMFLCDGYAPSIKQLPSVTVILSLSALCAFAVDWIWGQNYMFLREVPDIGFLQEILRLGGYPAYWLTLGSAVLAGCALLLVWGQRWAQHRQTHEHEKRGMTRTGI